MYRRKIEGFIDSHRNEMTEDIYALYWINNEKMPYAGGKPYGEDPFQALQAVLSMVEGYGFTIRNHNNYVGTANLNDKKRQLDILTHLDVVPAGEGRTETEPLEPMAKDGKLFDRGTANDKRPVVAALYTMRAVKEPGIPLNKSVELILDTDEECGNSDIINYYGKESEAPMTLSPDAELPIISIERGRLESHFHTSFQASEVMPRLVEAEAGIEANMVPGKARTMVEGIDLRTLEAAAETVEKGTGISLVLKGGLPVMTVTTQRGGIHVSTPREGKSALTDLLIYLTRLSLAECPQTNMIENLLKLFSHGDTCRKATGVSTEDRLSGNLTLAFSILTVGADDLEDVLDSRCPVCAMEESVLGVIERTMANHGLTLEDDFMIPSHHVDGDSHLVEILLSIYEDCTGPRGDCQAIGGSTYVRSPKNGVAYGAALSGTDNRMHEADRFAIVDELVLSAKILAQVTVELCS